MGKLVIVLGVIAYCIWPLDLIPDVPGVGWIDDIAVVVAGLKALGKKP
jgi:uncharacterized membrane protein YkvA (DUF1232 family)